MIEAITGTGLSASAGLNAYIPLLSVAVLARTTDLVELPDGWRWLDDWWMIAALAMLLAIELVADKVPAVDHVNDVVQTAVRPTAGGLAFGATATSESAVVAGPGDLLQDGRWVPIAAGVAIALVVHAVKALTRYGVNAVTFGLGAPVISTVEDGFSLSLAVVAIVAPLAAPVLLALLAWALVAAVQRRRSPAEAPHAPRPT